MLSGTGTWNLNELCVSYLKTQNVNITDVNFTWLKSGGFWDIDFQSDKIAPVDALTTCNK